MKVHYKEVPQYAIPYVFLQHNILRARFMSRMQLVCYHTYTGLIGKVVPLLLVQM